MSFGRDCCWLHGWSLATLWALAWIVSPFSLVFSSHGCPFRRQALTVSLLLVGSACGAHATLPQEVLGERWPPTSSSKVYHEKLSRLPLLVCQKLTVKVFVGPGLLPSECVSSTDQACLPRHPDALVVFLFYPVQALAEILGHRIGLETKDAARSEFDVFFLDNGVARLHCHLAAVRTSLKLGLNLDGLHLLLVHVEESDSESRNFC